MVGRVHLLDVVHGLDGLLGVILVGVTDETESAAPTSVTVLNHNLYSGDTRVLWSDSC